MKNITYLPKKRAPPNFKTVTYHVDEENNVIATSKANLVFVKEHDYRYYNRVVIVETRVL